MHPTRAATILATIGAALLVAALALRGLALGQAVLGLPQAQGQPPELPRLGGYSIEPGGARIFFLQSDPADPSAPVRQYAMPAEGGPAAPAEQPQPDLAPFVLDDGAVFVEGPGEPLRASPEGETALLAARAPEDSLLAFVTEVTPTRRRLYILTAAADQTIPSLQWLGEERAFIDLAWSPDGQRLAFISPRDGVDQVFTVGRTGQDYRALTTGPGRKSSPVWTADGRGVAYLQVEGGPPSIRRSTPTPVTVGAPPIPPALRPPTAGDIYWVPVDATGDGGATGSGGATGDGGATGNGGATGSSGATGDGGATGSGGSEPATGAIQLTNTPEIEFGLAWLPAPPGQDGSGGLAYAARLPDHPDTAFLYVLEGMDGLPERMPTARRVYPPAAVAQMECPAIFQAGQPAVVRITLTSSARSPLDLPMALRAGPRAFGFGEDAAESAVRLETITLLPGETRVLEWEVRPAAGRVTHVSAVADIDPPFPIFEQHCAAPNQIYGLPNLPYLAFTLPLLPLGAALCLPRLLQLRRPGLWLLLAAAPAFALLMAWLEMRLS